MTGNRLSRIGFTFVLIAAYVMTAVALPPSVALAGSASAGAPLVLRVLFPSTWPWDDIHWQDLWTVVQWQDRGGNWHDVEGWQGTPDGIVGGEGRKTWWLSRHLCGQGPFRWVIYAARGGEPLATSEPFHLPTAPGQLLRIEVGIEPP